jgi:uncharacterized phage protein (TIGR02220 family)
MWKQPTPTDINFNRNLTFLERAIFREILSFCQNESYLCQFIQAGKRYAVQLERGQMILKVSEVARDLKIDPKRVRQSVTIISKWYSGLEIKAMPYGLIITVKDYDTLVEMESQKDDSGIVAGESKDSSGRANKILKSNKILKKNLNGEQSKDSYARFIDFFNEVSGRNFGYLDKKARKQYEHLVKNGVKREEFETVIRNAYADPFHKENNYKHLTPEFLTRTDKFDKFAHSDEKRRSKKTADPKDVLADWSNQHNQS